MQAEVNDMNVEISGLNLLIPEKFISYKEELEVSIKNLGIISPIVVANGIVCDGHRRVAACLKLGINDIPVIEIKGDPVELLFELNDREFDINTVAVLTKNLSDKQIAKACKKAGFSDSPQMVFAVKYQLLENDADAFNYQMPANIWRELGHLGDSISKYASDLLKMSGTVGEKRNIAAFLRQAQRRGELPESIKAENAAEILPLLQKTAQPRRTEAYEKYEKAVAAIEFPNGVSLKIDPTFAQPGVVVTVPVMANDLEKLDRTKQSLVELFKAVPEL